MSHTHFNVQDRTRIQIGIENSLSHRSIALQLGVSHTAVNQEVKQNSVALELIATTRVNTSRILSLDLRTRRGRGEVPTKLLALARYKERLAHFARGQPVYDAEVAHCLYLGRRQAASAGNYKLHDNNELGRRIADLLTSTARDSPEQIAANLKKENIAISAQTIYRWIQRSSHQALLVQGLRRRGRRRRTITQAWNSTKGKRSIHTRPVVIEHLTRYGDLEGDTIFGRDSKDRILSHVDRATGLLSLSLIIGYDSYKIYQQTCKDIARVFGAGVTTITYDNGSEFAAWKLTESTTNATIYFADPYRSSQRGRNENANGLVRDYFPKGTDFKQITGEQLQAVENILNSRSRKRYNWKNPLEQRKILQAMA
jgi:IS30 family transposase